MANNTTQHFYCDLEDFSKTYQHIHGTLSVLVCVFGSVANILNICVLTRKEMRWPTNLILTGLAVADLLVMFEYIPFAFLRYILDRRYVNMYSYNKAIFMVFHALFSQACHFISCTLTVILAVWRLVTLTSINRVNLHWFNVKNTIKAIIITYVICPLICYPVYLSISVKEYNQTCDRNGFIIDKHHIQNYTGQIYNKIIYYTYPNDNRILALWIYGVIIKLIPCILLTILSSALIYVLLQTKKRRKALLNPGLQLKKINASSTTARPLVDKRSDQDRQADKTSTMLLAVLLLFLITEFPQAILGLLSVTIGNDFEIQCYNPLGDVMDILALTNSAINFILYCTMSRQFRTTFKNVFWPKICQSWYALTRHSSNEKTNSERTMLSHL